MIFFMYFIRVFLIFCFQPAFPSKMLKYTKLVISSNLVDQLILYQNVKEKSYIFENTGQIFEN